MASGLSDAGRHGMTIRIEQTPGEDVYSCMAERFQTMGLAAKKRVLCR
jgi:hypothetical protein